MQFDWVTFVLEIVNFLILVWILKRFLYRPILKTIARRKAAIDRTLADAKTKTTDAEALERQYRDRLSDWEKEKQALRAQFEEEMKATRARRTAALDEGLEQEREKRRMLDERKMSEWRTRAAEEAVAQGTQFAGRLLSRLATPELEARLVAMALEDVKHFSEEQLQALRAACRDGDARMTVTTAFPLDEPRRRALVRGLSEVAQAQLTAQFSEDPRLVAGLRVAIGPWVLHANLQDELKFFGEVARDGP